MFRYFPDSQTSRRPSADGSAPPANDHVAAGQRTVDWDGVFQGLKKHGFSGYVAIDVGIMLDLDAQYRESLEFLKRKAEICGL